MSEDPDKSAIDESLLLPDAEPVQQEGDDDKKSIHQLRKDQVLKKKQEQKKKAQEEKKEVAESIKPGDYSIHLYIQKTKDLNIEPESEESVIIDITCLGEKATSSTKEKVMNTSVTNWRESMFLELKQQSAQHLDDAKIQISIYEKTFIGSNRLIGSVFIDFSTLYLRDKHTMQHVWMAVVNTEGADWNQVGGYIKLSCGTTGENETPIELLEDPQPDSIGTRECLIPESIKPKFTQLYVTIYKGEHLPLLDKPLVKFLGEAKMDAYVKARLGTRFLRTTTKKTQGLDKVANWNQRFLIPVQVPSMYNDFMMQIYDQDSLNDELAGSLHFEINKLLELPQNTYMWVNLYGATGQEGVFAKNKEKAAIMNESPNQATKWNGRILMSVESKPNVEKPQFMVEQLGKSLSTCEKYNQFSANQTFSVRIYIGHLLRPPVKKDLRLKINVSLGEHEWNFEPLNSSGQNYLRFNKLNDLDSIEVQLPYKRMKNMPDIFIRCMTEKGVIYSYARIPANNFLHQEDLMDLNWIELLPDIIFDKCKSPEKAGTVSFRIAIREGPRKENLDLFHNDEEFMQTHNYENQLPNYIWLVKPRPRSYLIRAFVFQCQNLPSADETGTSDPYTVLYATVDQDSLDRKQAKKSRVTRVVNNTCYPQFFQTLEASGEYYDTGDPSQKPPVILDIYDSDSPYTKVGDDYMCRCLIPINPRESKLYCKELTKKMKKADKDLRNIPDPIWFDCHYKRGDNPCGKILCSFFLCDIDYQFQCKKSTDFNLCNTYVKFEEQKVSINVLGLRNLKSKGIMPVKKATIMFGLQSLTAPHTAAHLENKTTRPGNSGPNPSINSVIEFKLDMPIREKFSPVLPCYVTDKIFKGSGSVQVGVFYLDLGKARSDYIKQSVNVLSQLTKIYHTLKMINRGEAVQEYKLHKYEKRVDLTLDVDHKKSLREIKEVQNQMLKNLGKIAPSEGSGRDNFKSKEKNGYASVPGEAREEKKSEVKDIEMQILAENQVKQASKPLLEVDWSDEESDNDLTDNYVPLDLTSLTDNQIEQEQQEDLFETNCEDLQSDVRQTLKAQQEESIKEDQPSMPQMNLDISKIPNQDEISNAIETGRAEDLITLYIDKAEDDKNKQEIMNTQQSGYSKNTDFTIETEAKELICAEDTDKAKRARQLIAGGLRNIRAKTKLWRRTQMQIPTETQRSIAQAKLDTKRPDISKRNLIWPVYKMDNRLKMLVEYKKPPKELFIECGWDRDRANPLEKHYRRRVDMELEKEKFTMGEEPVFMNIDIKRGQKRGADDDATFGSWGRMFSKTKIGDSGEPDTEQIVGSFKGNLQVVTESYNMLYNNTKAKYINRIYDQLVQLYHQETGGKSFPFDKESFHVNQKDIDLDSQKYAEEEQVQAQQSVSSRLSQKSSFRQELEAWNLETLETQGEDPLTEVQRNIQTKEGSDRFINMTTVKLGIGYLKIQKTIMQAYKIEKLQKQLLRPKNVTVRIYLVDAFDLKTRDVGSDSDPYVVVEMGEHKFDDSENYVDDATTLRIDKVVDFPGTFPGCPLLRVAMMDKDTIFGDDLIGETFIDMEDRYFNNNWSGFRFKPIEQRILKTDDSSLAQGSIRLWTEIIPKDANRQQYDTSPEPGTELQVRVCIMDSKDLKMPKGNTDGVVRCFFDAERTYIDTDTHWRNYNGICSWNWRMLFTHQTSDPEKTLKVQAFDRDIFSGNDLIGEGEVDLTQIMRDVSETKRQMCMSKKYIKSLEIADQERDEDDDALVIPHLKFEDEQTFWIQLTTRNEKGKLEKAGQIRIQVNVVPMIVAKENKVGSGQDLPNTDPYLPKPFGRIEFSMNPLKMLRQLIGPAFDSIKRKLCCACCFVICLLLCVYMIPQILATKISDML